MRSTIEAEIQALTRAFVEDLVLLVKQQTLEAVLAQLEMGAGVAPERPRARRRRKAEPETVVIKPVRRRAQRRTGKAVETVAAAQAAPEDPRPAEEAGALEELQPAALG